MQPSHLCQNSITLNNQQKQFAEASYQPLLSELQRAAKTFSTKKNIYLGGSLALKEPALFCPQNKLTGMHSDLDIFVVSTSFNDLAQLQQLPRLIANISPELERSFHFSPLIKPLNNIYSISLEDLSVGIDTPIIEEIAIDHAAYQYPPQAKSMAHYFISKLCSYCLPYRNTSHAYSNLDNNQATRHPMDTIKLVLTGLRLQFYGVINNTHGIHSIPALAEQGYFKQIMSKADILRWIFHREQYDPTAHLPEINMPSFILNCWQEKLSLNNAITFEKIIQATEQNYFNKKNILDKLALVLFAGCFCQLSSNEKHSTVFNYYLDHYYSLYPKPALNHPKAPHANINTAEREILLIQLYNHYLQSTTNSIIPPTSHEQKNN
ncbi:hypothetical protein AVI51_06880 [Piscirickettsia salmonis]|uniref:Uncharacterized protein n=1 Tax=Piscirickettsia salmonis TaxID=1238 RepID=A0A9Q5YHG2_PISSA|nr:hypothetical protein [Piscirickettsia salmonis]ALA25800.1 diguanylate phosphodiesterase [Piscirickettsia salmonis]APS43282.1 hypothetical protein AVI48_02075 [Piscirickettsia salmonis]APS46631.1 hypothetical protein AVI49_02680 [Piscirickettsia salmonis]APS50610.1 hypothetical protein AVI50_06965 [Piscirickettsia salmonis]APS53811.1 hypothetical protein AVI51_06880 [Piscirickettsia salmonis]